MTRTETNRTIYPMPKEFENNFTFDKDWRIAEPICDATICHKKCDFVEYVQFGRKFYQVFRVIERSGINRIDVIFV